MLSDQLQELAKARATVARLQQAIEADLTQELAALPTKYGFSSVADFAAAVAKAGGKRRGRKRGKAMPAAKPAAGGRKKRRKRAVITDATKAEVKKLVAAGKTGREIAQAVGISMPSVANIKRELGLTKK